MRLEYVNELNAMGIIQISAIFSFFPLFLGLCLLYFAGRPVSEKQVYHFLVGNSVGKLLSRRPGWVLCPAILSGKSLERNLDLFGYPDETRTIYPSLRGNAGRSIHQAGQLHTWL